jgi:hypothetical protein
MKFGTDLFAVVLRLAKKILVSVPVSQPFGGEFADR